MHARRRSRDVYESPGGGRGSVKLSIDLTHRAPYEIGEPNRTIGIEITPVLANIRPGKSWRLTGRLKSRATLDALNVEFGEVPNDKVGEVRRVVKVKPHMRLDALVVSKQHDKCEIAIVKASGEFQLLISPRPDLPPGPFSDVATIAVITESGEKLFVAELPITGTVLPEVVPIPSVVLLPPTVVGQRAESVITLRRPRADLPRLLGIEIDQPELQISQVGEAGAQASEYRVVYRITKPGDQSATARFTFQRKNGSVFRVELTVNCRGISPMQ